MGTGGRGVPEEAFRPAVAVCCASQQPPPVDVDVETTRGVSEG